MRIRAKAAEKEWTGRGVARAALDGASRKELLLEALRALTQQGSPGRIGVWLEADGNANPQNKNIAGFHGTVWERGNLEPPQEWAHLSVEPPLPEELLLRGNTVEQDLEASPPNPILGLLGGLRHALWVPIEGKEQLKGVILAGSKGKQPARSGVTSRNTPPPVPRRRCSPTWWKVALGRWRTGMVRARRSRSSVRCSNRAKNPTKAFPSIFTGAAGMTRGRTRSRANRSRIYGGARRKPAIYSPAA